MANTSTIISALGADVIQALCGVGEFSVRAARRDGQFPASWFDAIDGACLERGIDCPRDLFAFKRVRADEAAADAEPQTVSEGGADNRLALPLR
jgi:hypothetical protein